MHYGDCTSILDLADLFPTEDSAREWFESVVWPDGRCCPRCGCGGTKVAAATSGLPYYCIGCQKPFSVKIGTALQGSNVPLRKWIFAIYLEVSSLRGVSSLKLHRDIKVTQKTAWSMLNRIREAWAREIIAMIGGLNEVNEAHVDCRRENKTKRGTVGEAAVIGAMDLHINQRDVSHFVERAVRSTDQMTPRGSVRGVTESDSGIHTGETQARGMDRKHDCVDHGEGESVRKLAHRNGKESVWSARQRDCQGVHRLVGLRHLYGYFAKSVDQHKKGEEDAIGQMEAVVSRMIGERMMCRDLVS